MYLDSDNYEISSDLELDSLLSDLPIEVIKESIKEQVADPLSTNINYVNTIVEKCGVLRREFEENEDALKQINDLLEDFFRFLITEIDTKFDLTLDVSDDAVDTLVSIGEILYSFLILRYKKNISKFIYKFIIKNKKFLVEQFEKQSKKKDVTSISLKKQIKNKDDILLISNLPNVIKYIMNLYIEPLDFLKYACDDEYYEGSILKQMILSGKLVGNFVTEYLNLIVYDNDDILDEVQTDVKLKLLKKII